MSSLNVVNLPQTYSRLFRPWDCNTPASSKSQTISTANGALMNTEIFSSSANASGLTTSVMKMESGSFSATESDRECVSSNSSHSKSSSFDESFSINMQMESSPASSDITNNLAHPVAYANTYWYDHLQNNFPSHLQHSGHAPVMSRFVTSMPLTLPSDFYYAAAAAAAANGLPSVPTTSSSAAAAAAAAASYTLDPFAINVMEQEYQRVMAEDAHFKAVNARKQRPKKFKCPHCDVAFSNNGQLKGHIRIHTGERPFKCDVETCGKTFTRNEELTRHKRIHTGLKPFPCSACGKKFGRRDHLKKHMKTHMPQERQLGPAIFVSMYPYLYG